MTLTLDQLREHVTTSLGDEALQRVLDAAYASIEEYAGEEDVATVLAVGGQRFLALDRPAYSVTSVVEDYGSSAPVTLAADDYIVHPGGYVIERNSGGTNSRSSWYRRVYVTFVPKDDAALRDMVAVDLVALDLTVKLGVTMEVVGSWTQQYAQSKSYDELRDEALSRLSPEPRMVVVGG